MDDRHSSFVRQYRTFHAETHPNRPETTPLVQPPITNINGPPSMPRWPPSLYTYKHTRNVFDLQKMVKLWLAEKNVELPNAPQQQNGEESKKNEEEFDINSVKSRLIDMLQGEVDVSNFCKKVVYTLCSSLKADMGALYLFSNHINRELLIFSAYPTVDIFAQYFNPFYHMIASCVEQKECFSVETPTDTVFFLGPVVPPCGSDNDGIIGVLVLSLQKEESLDRVKFMDNLNALIPVLSSYINYIHTEQMNVLLKMQVQEMVKENTKLKELETKHGGKVCLMCTNNSGLITQWSETMELILGYHSTELVGTFTPANLILPSELAERTREMENYLGRKVSSFQVLTEYFLLGDREPRRWTFLSKACKPVPLLISLELLYNESLTPIGFAFHGVPPTTDYTTTFLTP